MVLNSGDSVCLDWQIVVTDVDNINHKFVYRGGAFVDIYIDDEAIDTFCVWDFTIGRSKVQTLEQLLAAIELRMLGGSNGNSR